MGLFARVLADFTAFQTKLEALLLPTSVRI